jgi:hypothetical protein
MTSQETRTSKLSLAESSERPDHVRGVMQKIKQEACEEIHVLRNG